MGVIYKITSPTGRIYIGKTTRLKTRIWEYRWRSKKRKSIIHDSIKRYGWEAHKFEVIEEILDDKLLSEREIYWISELNSYYINSPARGMNMTMGGERGGRSWMHDTERRKKQSEIFKGEGGSFYGHKHTEETKKIIAVKISQRNKERSITVPKWAAEKGRLKVIKPILCYNEHGVFIREYASLTEAAKEVRISISSVKESCKGLISGVFGKYVFKYKLSNSYPINIKVNIKERTVKRPILFLTEKYEVVCEYPSAKEASEFWKIPKTTINRAAMYNWLIPIRGGHVFIYKDLYEEILKAAS
jgi:group I intron endonuclease